MTIHNLRPRAKGDLAYFSDFTNPADPLDAVRREINLAFASADAKGDKGLRSVALNLLASMGALRKQFGVGNGRWQ